MKQKLPDRDCKCPRSWPGRILILAIAGILFLTLFPFRFSFHTELAGGLSPFLLQSGMKSAGVLDDFLNVLLFVPFGFGLTGKLLGRDKPRIIVLLYAWAAGALVSYGVEFLQNYIPSRDAGWHDVLTNSTGAVAGCLLFELAGENLLRALSEAEHAISNTLTRRRAVWIIPLYFAAWIGFSIPLQTHARLADWDSHSVLAVGNFVAGKPNTAWKGNLYRLEFWDRAIPGRAAKEMTAGNSSDFTSTGPVASYDFSAAPPIQDRTGSLPDLDWNSSPSSSSGTNPLALDGKSWLISEMPVSRLGKNFAKTKQFSLRVVCAPANVTGTIGRIVTISRGPGAIDLDIKQEGTDLVFWFRNGLSARRSILPWNIPNVFQPNRVHDILLSFDGANLSLFVDGRKDNHVYLLGPGAVLAHFFRAIKTSELEAYNYVYYALIFFIGGVLIGITLRSPGPYGILRILSLSSGFVLPAVILELVLTQISGRTISFTNMILGFCLAAAGSLWINADF